MICGHDPGAATCPWARRSWKSGGVLRAVIVADGVGAADCEAERPAGWARTERGLDGSLCGEAGLRGTHNAAHTGWIRR